MSPWQKSSLLRARDGHEAKVSNMELFFDLVYVFAVTQLSHRLLHHLDALGALQTLVLWFAVWLGWQYTCWVTNWFDPDAMPVRLLLFGVMLLALPMAAAIPDAFGERGLVFAACYAAMQVGRTLCVVLYLGRGHALTSNFRRILGWLCLAAVGWIAGGLSAGPARLAFWIFAVACEYLSPMIGFYLPGLGRSRSRAEWTIEGGHLAERCQLFVIVALGESLLATGATFSEASHWSVPVVIALLATFAASAAMWWLYFDTSSEAGTYAIVHAPDPGKIGAYFHYVHVTIVGAIIIAAVGVDLVMAHPAQPVDTQAALVLLGGPMLYVLANGIYKTIVYRWFPLSHLVGLALFGILAVFIYRTDLLMAGGLAALLLIVVAAWESLSRRRQRSRPSPA